MFTDNKVTIVKVNGETLHIKEERKLMNRILIASRSQPETDLPNIFGNYEFSVLPLSLLAPDSSLYDAKDKSSIAAELRKFKPGETYIEEEANNKNRKVTSFTAMAIVNQINIKVESLENCDEFVAKFCEIINFQGRGFDEVRIIFDHYDGKSLKSNTRADRNIGAVSLHCKVTDITRIRHLETKQFLASVATKKEFTIYLSRRLADYLNKEFVIAFERTCVTSIPDLDSDLKENGQEEADTGIIFHAADVCKRDPFPESTIICSDTDLLLIPLNYFDQLRSITTFKMTHHQYNLRSIYEKFTPRVSTALLGFHAMTGSNQTGKFNGFTKKTCWNTFVQSTDDILDVFIHFGTTDMNHNTDFKSLASFVVHLYRRNKVPPGVAD